MKTAKRFLPLLLVVALLISAVACAAPAADTPEAPAAQQETPAAAAPEATAEAAPAEQDKTFVFGISMPQLDNDGFKANLIGIKQFALENGVELLTADAKGTADMQMQQIEDFMTKGVDAIVMCPVDSGALVAAVEKATAAGIPVISFDRNVSTDKLTGLAESDNTAHGAKAADLMKEAADKAGIPVSELKVLELMGAQATTAGLERHNGFSTRAQELGINIIASLPAEWKMDLAYNAVMDAFQAHDDINAIYVPSDNALYSGVESALLQLGKLTEIGQEGHIIITTTDGGPQGLKGIRSKYVDACAAQSKLDMSREAMALAYMAAQGKEITEPIIRIQPTPITIENVEDPKHWANAINQ